MKILILLFLFAIISCSTSPVETKSQSDLKTISINSSDLFKGDPSKIQGWKNAQEAVNDDKATGHASLEKTVANISFKDAKVIVLWYNPEIDESGSNYFCDKHQNLFDSFNGKDLFKWSEIINGFNSFSYEEAVYSGDLEKSGNYVEGNISVKAGVNLIIVAFINSNDEIFYTTQNYYYYISGFDENAFYGYFDGWLSVDWIDLEYWGYSFGNTNVGVTQVDVDSYCN